MKRLFSSCFFILFILYFGLYFDVSSLYAENLKIGIFDIQKIMKESKVIEGYRQKIAREMESKRKSFIDRQEAAQRIEDRLKKEGQRISPRERKELEERLADEIKELRRMKEDIDMELQKTDRELTQKAFQEIGEVIKQIADAENYTVIFEKSSAGIVHFKDSVDITGKIIKIYDRK